MINRLKRTEPNGHSATAQRSVAEEPATAADGAVEWLESIVVQYPRATLVSAVVLGAALAWLIKRR